MSAAPVPAGLLREEGDRLRLQTPLRYYLIQGTMGLVLGPVAGALLALLFLLMLGDDPVALGVAGLLGGGLGLLGAAAGLVQLLSAPYRASRSGCVFDLTAGTCTLADGRVLETASLRRLRIGKPNAAFTFIGLLADAPVGPVVLLRGLPPRAGAGLCALADVLSPRIGLPIERSSSLIKPGLLGLRDDRSAAAFCWIPVQGIFILASLWFVVTAQDRPFVRFHARQSLTQLGCSLFVLGGALLFGAGAWLGGRALHAPEAVGIALFAICLGAFFVWNVGTRIIGAVMAWRGRAWAAPWLRPFLGAARPPEQPRG